MPRSTVPAMWSARTSRVGLVGYGFIAGGHLTGITRLDGVEVVAVADVCLERRVAAQRELPGVHVVGDLAELDADGLDALLICTPPGSHLDAIAFGLEAGLAVICEKPLVPTVRDLEALEAACAAAPGLLYPSHNYLSAPSVQSLLRIVSEQRCSDGPLSGHLRTQRVGHARGVPEWRPDWRRDRLTSGGGIVQDHGPHSFYLASAFVGRRPDRVRCDLRHPVDGPFRDTEDYAFIHLSYDDGSRFTIELDWNASVRQTSYLLYGEWGHARVIDDQMDWSVGGSGGSRRTVSNFDDPSHSEWFESVWRGFLDPARVDERFELLDEALWTVKIVAGCYRSAAEAGAWVHLGDDSTARRAAPPTPARSTI